LFIGDVADGRASPARKLRGQRGRAFGVDVADDHAGARVGKDGVSATAFHLSNCRTAPIEIIESEFPTTVERFEMLADSGGAGEWRGGLGFVREYRLLADDVRFSMRTDKHAIEPFGSSAGLPGGKGACRVNPTTKEEKSLPSRFGDHRLGRNDRIRIERPGGGGLGNPFDRPVEKVLDDLRQGYVTVGRARSDYGVAAQIVEGEPRLYEGETARLRGKKG